MSESFKRPLQSTTSTRNMNSNHHPHPHTSSPTRPPVSTTVLLPPPPPPLPPQPTVRRKGCNCKKSGCLKLYCECFASNIRCGERCQCLGCKNHQHNEEEIAKAIDVIEKRTQKPFRPASSTPSSTQYHTPNNTTTTSSTTNRHTRDTSVVASAPSTRPSSATSTSSTNTGSKGCSCKKSGCLKLYCECLASQKYCDSKCHCEGCKNHPDMAIEREKAIATILERNPMAFQPKVGKTTTSGGTGTNQQQVVINLRGCNCRKSNCMKNYCECHQAGVACTSRCACHECRNTESFVSAKKMLVFNTPERQMRKKNQPITTPSSAPAHLNRLHTFAAHISSRLQPLPPPPQQQQQQRLPIVSTNNKNQLYDSKTSPLTPLLEAAMATTRAGLTQGDESDGGYSNVPNSAPVPGYKRRYEEMMKHHRRGQTSSSSVRRKRMVALQLQLEKIEEEEMHRSDNQEEDENDGDEKEIDGGIHKNHTKSHLVARVELPSIDKTLEAGRKTMSKLCRSLLHAAMAVDADTPTPTPSTTPKASTIATGNSSSSQKKKKKVTGEEEAGDGSMSPSTQELLCAEDIDKENEEELEEEEAKPLPNSLAKPHVLRASAAQERAILQEFSVWIRNIATNE